VYVVVLVPGGRCGRENGIPDYGFGSRFVGFGRGVDGFYVEEDLFCVPVEEATKIY
jgi:hypothetical protein